MAKRKSFDEILSADFRWPQHGDKPFLSTGDPSANAYVAVDEFTRLVLMVDGYKEAADLMVAASADDQPKRNTLIFPIIFNYRQFLELALKYQLATFGPAVGVKPVWDTHCLERLWRQFIEMLERYGTEDPDEADLIVGEVVLEFAKIDPDSSSYRYPVDRRGKPIPVAISDLHLPTLADVMEGVSGYFKGCDGFLNARRDASFS